MEKAKNIVIYCGNDKGYFQTLSQRYTSNYAHLDLTVQLVAQGAEYLPLLSKIIELEPEIVYIDFSFDLKTSLKLSRQLNRLSTFSNVPIVGLVDDTSNLKECWASGVDFTHVKCGEVHDVLYHPMTIARPEQVKKPSFAKGKFKVPIEVDLINDFRIGYITPEYIHAEGDFPQKKGDVLKLETSLPKDLIPSQKFLVNDVTTSDLYYDFEYAYNLGIKFVDDPVFDDSELDKAMALDDPKAKDNLLKQIEQSKSARKEDHKNQLRICKKKHKAWVLDKLTFSKPKKTKVLIVDKEMSFLKTVKGTLDQYPYTIRLQTELTEDIRSLQKVFPHIIAMNFTSKSFLDSMNNPNLTEIEKEALKEEFKVRETNALNQVGRLIKRIRATENYTPFVIIFNCTNYTSKALQDTYEYPLVMCHTGPMDLSFVLKMAELFEKKQEEKYEKIVEEKIAALRKEDPVKHGRLTKDNFEEKRYFVGKSDPLSFVSSRMKVELDSISESDLTFSTHEELAIGSYRLEVPVKCSITIVPVDGKNFVKDGGKNYYRALIHSVGELDKKELRRYVNDTFFTDINEKREQEKKDFDELNKSKHDEIINTPVKTDKEALDDFND